MTPNCGTILVAREDEIARARLCRLLQAEGYATVEAASGEQALLEVENGRPALVILSVLLPGICGYDVCRQLRRRFGESIAIIFVSAARVATMDRVAGLLVGADDYIVEPYAEDELLARVWRACARIEALASREADAVTVQLTPREQEILGLLATGLPPKVVATQLSISPKTVETHIQRILLKLDVHSRREAVAHAYRLGLIGPNVFPQARDAESAQLAKTF